ncbi:hypothetical protein D3H55_18130 [Bacillus salacetis]|uniref:Uncharacterized protein n=1 Tax=Bacillus salacetis TaxID=2315464 RepID=A0A3A1QR97_9BACI|nr:hypothetical protein D3H55_18130 [Bacillus salacetis]
MAPSNGIIFIKTCSNKNDYYLQIVIVTIYSFMRRLFSHILLLLLLLSEKSQVTDFSTVSKGLPPKKNGQLFSFLLTGVFTGI